MTDGLQLPPLCPCACTRRSGDQELQLKLLARLRCCCQLEALLDALLPVGGF